MISASICRDICLNTPLNTVSMQMFREASNSIQFVVFSSSIDCVGNMQIFFPPSNESTCRLWKQWPLKDIHLDSRRPLTYLSVMPINLWKIMTPMTHPWRFLFPRAHKWRRIFSNIWLCIHSIYFEYVVDRQSNR